MLDGLAAATELILAHKEVGGLLVGALVLVECAALIGVVFPATATMMAIGGLIGAKLLDPMVVAPPAIVGAAVGGWLSYRLGRWLGPSVLHRWPLKRYRPTAARARLLFRHHGVSLVLLARFYAPARATVPLVAGVMNMHRRRFYVADALAAVFWVASLLTLGSVAAATLDGITLGPTGKLLVFAGIALTTSGAGTFAVKRLLGSEGNRRRPAAAMRGHSI